MRNLVETRCAAVLALVGTVTASACAGDDPATVDDGGVVGVDAAAGDGGAAVDGGTGTDAGARPPSTLGPAERPARLVVPPAHDGTTPLPLLVLLHGYSASGMLQDLYLGVSAVARDMGFYLLLPDGLVDSAGNHYWNATDACCDFDGSGVDDVAYLSGLVDEAKSVLPVDEGRVYFFGHSNGAFMSYRMACERADMVTAVATLAGAEFLDEARCAPSEGVSVLHLHGDADDTILYGGNAFYPSAQTTVERWARRDGCDDATTSMGDPLDLETVAAGAETTVTRYDTGCDPGLAVELWTLVGVGHIPTPTPAFTPSVAAWLLARSK